MAARHVNASHGAPAEAPALRAEWPHTIPAAAWWTLCEGHAHSPSRVKADQRERLYAGRRV